MAGVTLDELALRYGLIVIIPQNGSLAVPWEMASDDDLEVDGGVELPNVGMHFPDKAALIEYYEARITPSNRWDLFFRHED